MDVKIYFDMVFMTVLTVVTFVALTIIFLQSIHGEEKS